MSYHYARLIGEQTMCRFRNCYLQIMRDWVVSGRVQVWYPIRKSFSRCKYQFIQGSYLISFFSNFGKFNIAWVNAEVAWGKYVNEWGFKYMIHADES